MTLQWMRQCEVVIGNAAAGRGLFVSEPRITFEVEKTVTGRTPNTATIKMFNLTPDHENQIRGEFDEVLIKAGYQGLSLVVFAGSIRHAYRYREGVDWITEIDAADGDFDLRNTIINTVLAAGTTTSDALNHVVGKLQRTKLGHAIVKERKRIRGRVVSGGIDKLLNQIAMESDANWSIQNGVLEMVPVESTLPTEAIVLRSDTGLLGAPEVDDKGINAECLLNPQIRINGKVQLDNNSLRDKVLVDHRVSSVTKPQVEHRTKPKATKRLSRLDPDGIYKVIKVVHKGDNRGTSGDDWSTKVLCVALNKPIPASAKAA